MSRENIALIFEGASVHKGDIDIENLAPALLSLSNLIQKANETINGDRASVSVRVQASKQGSFEVSLDVVQTLSDAARSFLDFASINKDKVAAANELCELIFKGGVLGGGLIALLKFLKGKKPEKIEEHNSETIVYIDSHTFITNNKVIALAENLAVRDAVRKTMLCLTKDGIDRLSIRKSNEDLVNIKKDEVSYFDLPEAGEEKIDDKIRSVRLQIISLSFKEDNKWRVTDGFEPFSVDIEDADFIKKIANDEIAFSKNDYLVCDLHERQFYSNKGLRMERTIIKVSEHIPGFRQLKLI